MYLLHSVLLALFQALYDIFGDCRSYLMPFCKRRFGRYPICGPVVLFLSWCFVFNASGLFDIMFGVTGVLFQRTILEFPFLFQSQRPLPSLPTECRALLGLTMSPHRKFNTSDTRALLLHIHLRALHPLGRSNVLLRPKKPLYDFSIHHLRHTHQI
jgi:hypothetical protein